jgi:CheY-like chemotaxis protein
VDVSKTSLPPKSRWHPLSLQQLEPTKFADVVNRILDGELSVLHSRVPRESKRVLVTDDNEKHAQLLIEHLETDWGLAVDHAKSSEACIQCLEKNHYDLLILDYRLPRRDGLWVVDELARRGRRVPIMMITSFYHPQLHQNIRSRIGVEVYDKSDGSFERIARAAGRLLSCTASSPLPATS